MLSSSQRYYLNLFRIQQSREKSDTTLVVFKNLDYICGVAYQCPFCKDYHGVTPGVNGKLPLRVKAGCKAGKWKNHGTLKLISIEMLDQLISVYKEKEEGK